MPHDLHALRLTTRQRRGLATHGQVPEPDRDEMFEALDNMRLQRRDRRRVEASHPLEQLTDRHERGIGDALLANLARPRLRTEPRALARVTRPARHDPLKVRPQ